MKIDRRSTQPLYAQLKELLIDRIRQQTYAPGQQIPSEMALCQELSLSRPTVRQAIAELVSEGILVIVKGRGTFVADEPERIEVKNLIAGQFSLLTARSLDHFDHVEIEKVTGDAELDRLFGASDGPGHPGYWSIAWQQTENGQTYAFCRTLVPVSMFPELGPDLSQGKRMIDITANKYAYLPQKTAGRLFVRQARTEESQILDISRNAPVLVLSSRSTSRSGNVCEISTAALRADLVALNLDSGRS
ncbi:MAG: GntR family transcriptional regulator [Eubacteriales bacterium]|nr:GntR family transcriptional regulator [Eubacteriales bacterium]MDD4140874.1 GntR family transcriptional regulator [Eubacteriales bacterium]MDD4743142.1 GntR family transcriptional regulator [Eubacteriales bacterium]